MKVVERMLGKKTSQNSVLMKCNLALCLRGAIDVVFIMRWIKEEYDAKGKRYVCALWT